MCNVYTIVIEFLELTRENWELDNQIDLFLKMNQFNSS
jgi:hypothetical protein